MNRPTCSYGSNICASREYEEAAKLLAGLTKDKDALVNPGEWWVEQRIISRGLLDQRVSSRRPMQSRRIILRSTRADIVDAEFHAGWYALRGLKDASTATQHFQRILKASNRPISVSRAWYWMGRAAEAGAPGDAKEYFAKAATLPGTFYGQLAAARAWPHGAERHLSLADGR